MRGHSPIWKSTGTCPSALKARPSSTPAPPPPLRDAPWARWATIGKGKRAPQIAEACQQNGGVYFCTIGGAAALLACRVKESELVGWEDLGTEALRRLQLEDFPVFVATDPTGRDLYREVEAQ